MSGLASRRSLTTLKHFFLALVCAFAGLMAISTVQAQEIANPVELSDPPSQIEQETSQDDPAGTLIVARYYAKRFKGRKTSSGEIYAPEKLTAAHPTLPLGTQVKVVNPDNNRSVMVTINDRCGKRKEVYIDLSRQAARELGILRQGKAMVRMILLDEDEGDDEEDENPLPENQENEKDASGE